MTNKTQNKVFECQALKTIISNKKLSPSLYPRKMPKKHKFLLIFFALIFMVAIIFGIWIWNLSYASYTDFEKLVDVKFSIVTSIKLVFSGQYLEENNIKYINLQATVWISLASILSGIALSIAGCVTQSLTKNPLADSGTLGIVNATVFMVVIAFALKFNVAETFNKYHLTKTDIVILFAFAGGILSSLMLFILVFGANKKLSYIKITLAGLAIGIFFNTITYYIRIQSSSGSQINFLYVLGGAENIFNTHVESYKILWISAILILIGVSLAYLVSHKLTLIEIGDEKAKNLGTAIIPIKIIAIISTIFCIAPSIMLVGNVAFVGLFTPHIIRKIFSTRDYRIVMPLSALLGAILTSFGVVLFREVQYVNSSIWMTIIGAPTLAYVGWRHWNR